MSTIRYGMVSFYPRYKQVPKQKHSTSLFGKPKITNKVVTERESPQEFWDRVNVFVTKNRATPINFETDSQEWAIRLYYSYLADPNLVKIMESDDLSSESDILISHG